MMMCRFTIVGVRHTMNADSGRVSQRGARYAPAHNHYLF